MTMLYRNARHAIRDACARGNTCIGWDKERVGWVLYDPRDGAPSGVQPEMLCRGCEGFFALSDEGATILTQLTAEALSS